jgi:transcriptional regulator with XRE-family HTH domain
MKNTKKLAVIYTAGYTQATLAKALYIRPGTLCRYLSGARQCPPETQRRAAALLHVDLAELFPQA